MQNKLTIAAWPDGLTHLPGPVTLLIFLKHVPLQLNLDARDKQDGQRVADPVPQDLRIALWLLPACPRQGGITCLLSMQLMLRNKWLHGLQVVSFVKALSLGMLARESVNMDEDGGLTLFSMISSSPVVNSRLSSCCNRSDVLQRGPPLRCYFVSTLKH